MSYVNFIKPAYFNEFDPYAADWLENLIRLGEIAPGDVDRRSIEDVCPDDLRGFRQCHFFSGIGIWSYSLRRAGVPDDAHLWTGSPPCQPFSAAGKGDGVDDERHLWPAFFHLIRECRPHAVYGEQVASKDGLGWLDLVFSDMEAAGYAFGAVDTCSASSGAPHIRQRLRFYSYDLRSSTGGIQHTTSDRWNQRWAEPGRGSLVSGCSFDRVEHPFVKGLEGHGGHGDNSREPGWIGANATGSTGTTGAFDGLADAECFERIGRGSEQTLLEPGEIERTERLCDALGLADSLDGQLSEPQRGTERRNGDGSDRQNDPVERLRGERPCPTNGFWRNADWLFCRDGKWRPTQPFTQSLAHGYPADLGQGCTSPLVKGEAFKEGSGHPTFEGKSRQGMLKAYGNAVDAEATTDFIIATLGLDVGSTVLDADEAELLV